MNAAKSYNRRRAYARRYPNAADSRYFLNQLADRILCTASAMGFLTMLYFLLTM